ncbi:MAG: ORF6N domain-containing protein [Candidatus Symbiothrix sp.]|jgi:hypothetical protein|nr:ORF6N domain-containing protein [Candidatus Symbiothrix sp.]
MEQPLIQIQNKILEIRHQKVMLDSDLAALYGVETKQLKRAVKRNIERFEDADFMFELTDEERLRCQIGTSSWGGTRYQPYAFTELGVAMLSSVLNSPTAIKINKNIMRAFVAVRQFLSIPPIERLAVLEYEVKRLTANIEDAFADYNDINEDTRMQLELVNKSLAELQVHKQIADRPHSPAGFIAIHEARKKEEEAKETDVKKTEKKLLR